MFSALKPPVSPHESILEKYRFILIWNISLLMVPIFFVLMLIHLIFNDKNIITSISAMTLALLNLIVLKRTKEYKLISVVFVTLGMILCLVSILVINDSSMISDAMWIVMLSITCYYMFEFVWGALMTVIGMSGIIYDIFSSNQVPLSPDLQTMINLIYVTFAFILILFHISKTLKKSQEQYNIESLQKEVLLKEVHHRVKNNLQIISSLLKLQAEENGDPKLIDEFSKAISRIKSMSMIHEKMYHTSNLLDIDLKDYITEMMKNIVCSYDDSIVINTNFDRKKYLLEMNNMVPLSLIMNELVTNSIKHAFRSREKKELYLTLNSKGDLIELIYEDSGKWKETKSYGFGLMLIDILTQQLDGKYERLENSGNGFKFIFEAKELLKM